MSTDTPEFWDRIWSDTEDCGSGSDEILVDQVGHLAPGRALEIGCGTGGNAMWLAQQGWQVTAVDHSAVAIEKGRSLAAKQCLNVEFVVADASTCRPQGLYDLITCFYIQMFPRQRADMLANVSKALAPGGTFLFVSHDKSNPPSGWSAEDLLSLSTPGDVVSELSELQIEQAFVLNHDAQPAHASESPHDGEIREIRETGSTVVKATRPLR